MNWCISVISRVKQVISALTAHIEETDRNFVAEYLTCEEQKLFWSMNLPDQRHALNVAYTARELVLARYDINLELLTKAALLHDVGKVKGDVSTFDKIITVLADKIAPTWARQWGAMGRGSKLDNVKHAFYIYFHHAERSAEKLIALKTSAKLVAIVAWHHQREVSGDPAELKILKHADDLN